jgi:hypothetical protein
MSRLDPAKKSALPNPAGPARKETPNMPEKTPARLYKYQALDRQTLENLVNRCIYFSKPENFNDPFDCWEAIAFLDPMVDQEEWKKIYQNIVSTASKEN